MTPLGSYYETILRNPISYASHTAGSKAGTSAGASKPSHKRTVYGSGSPSNPSSAPSVSFKSAETAEEKEKKMSIVFGSRLLGPAEQADRLAKKKAQSTVIAGVLVPPRPEEPDNCCMSGCVNCVWDRYRDDIEEWSAQKNEAQARLQRGLGAADSDPAFIRAGAEGDAQRSASIGPAKISKNMWDEDILQNVPVGIREFMKQEKRLKEKHLREGTGGG
ncbi:hypothetical protein RJ55_03133 [Drechmeria coniospora]|nr:hypothetical protein RJ55_03133 [Drechmeria coniospora]